MSFVRSLFPAKRRKITTNDAPTIPIAAAMQRPTRLGTVTLEGHSRSLLREGSLTPDSSQEVFQSLWLVLSLFIVYL